MYDPVSHPLLPKQTYALRNSSDKICFQVEFESVSFTAASSSSFFFQYSSSGGPNIAFPETTPILRVGLLLKKGIGLEIVAAMAIVQFPLELPLRICCMLEVNGNRQVETYKFPLLALTNLDTISTPPPIRLSSSF